MKISQYTEIPQLGNTDYIPVSRRSSEGTWSSWKYKLSGLLSLIGFDTSTKRFSSSVLPANTLYSNTLITVSQILPRLFADALNANQTIYKHGSQTYSDVEQKPQTSTSTEMRANGYYPDVSGHEHYPYFAYGVWMTDMQALAMLFDRYTPFDGGTMCQSAVNMPSQPKSSDSRLSLDYAVCNNHRPKAVVFGTGGWSDSVSPTSLHRAFDNAINLRAVIGEINMESMSKAPYLFMNNCPELWQFHIANVPDAVERLDFSGCSADIATTFRYSDGSVTQLNTSLGYLRENYVRDITRTKPLTIKVPSSIYNTAVNIFAGAPDVTIVDL